MDSFNLSLNLYTPRLKVASSRLRAFATSRIVADFQSKTDKSDESRCHRKNTLPPLPRKYHIIKRTRVLQTQFQRHLGKLKRLKFKKIPHFCKLASLTPIQTCKPDPDLTPIPPIKKLIDIVINHCICSTNVREHFCVFS